MKTKVAPKKRIVEDATLSNSEAQLFLHCRQKWKWRHVDGLVPVYESTPLIVGKAWHKFLELWMSGAAVDEQEIINDEFKVARNSSFMSPEQLEDLEKQGAMVEGMMHAYRQVYADDRKKYKVIGAEKQGSFAVAPGWTMYFTVDLLVERKSDRTIWVMEHKSASTIDRDYVLRLDLDTQISTYLVGVRKAWGLTPAGVLYNVTKKPAIRQKQKEERAAYLQRVVQEFKDAPSEYLFRAEYLRSEESLSLFEKNLALLTGEMDRAKQTGFYPRNTQACFGKYGACPYVALCTSGEDAMDRFKVKRDARYDELKEEQR